MNNEKEIIKEFLLWCRLARSVQLQEMPEWTEGYYGIDEDDLIRDYLESK